MITLAGMRAALVGKRQAVAESAWEGQAGWGEMVCVTSGPASRCGR